MKKFTFTIFAYSALVFATGCISATNHNKISALTFSNILNFQIGTTGEDDLVKVLGKPSSVMQKDNYFVMSYDDPKTGLQKLAASINKTDKKVLSLIWTPEEGESERSLVYAKKVFENSSYQVKDDKDTSAHAMSSDIFFYIDKKSGVTIRYDKKRDKVEAIALYDRENRVPSSTK